LNNLRNATLDLLKLVMAILVVMAHCGFLYDWTPLSGYLVLNGIARLTVPVFFMINGFYFKINTDKSTFKKWLKRVALLYIFWMLFYSFLWVKHHPDHLIFTLLFGWHHLWYIISLLFSGLLLYSLRKWKLSTLLILGLTLFLLGTSFQYISKYELLYKIPFLQKSFIYKNFLFFGFPFFTLGYLIRQRKKSFEISKKILYLSFIISFILLLGESYFNYTHTKPLRGFDLMFSQLLVCPILLLCANKNIITSNINGKKVALYSSAIYFIHTIPMLYLQTWFKYQSYLLSISTILISIILSYFLIKINNKVKIIL